MVQPPEIRAGLDAQLERPPLVEAPESLVLDQRVPIRAHAMGGLERGDPVAVALELLVRLELDQRHLVGGAPHDRVQRVEQGAQPGRPVHRERALPSS